MVITYFGKEFVKIQQGDTTIALNAPGKDSKIKAPKFGADIALVSVNHKDYNGAENLFFGDKIPFVITGPGEYEVKNIFIKGIPSESSVGGTKQVNTIYMIQVDKMNVCFLGALSSKDLKSESREALESIDILFVPIGDGGVLAPSDAYSVAVSLEPKIIIPMDYEEGSEQIKKFLKEGGAQKTEAIDKLTIKPKDIEGKDAEIVVLAPSA